MQCGCDIFVYYGWDGVEQWNVKFIGDLLWIGNCVVEMFLQQCYGEIEDCIYYDCGEQKYDWFGLRWFEWCFGCVDY